MLPYNSRPVLCLTIVRAQLLSQARLFVAPWTVTRQARILELGAISSLGDPPNPGIETTSLASPALASRFFITSTTNNHLSLTEVTNLAVTNPNFSKGKMSWKIPERQS